MQRLNNGLCQNKRFGLDKTPNRRSFNRTQLHHAVSTQTCFIGSFEQNTPGYRLFFIATANFQQICFKELQADLNQDSISCDLKSRCSRMISNSFPNAEIMGCFFHYVKNFEKTLAVNSLTPRITEKQVLRYKPSSGVCVNK